MAPKNTPKRRKKGLDLQLFVAGSSIRSLRTIDSVKQACEKHAPGRYDLTIVDIYVQPEAAIEAHIVAAPTLIRRFPKPLRMFVGEISRASDLDMDFSRLAAAGQL
jgi:circadian clock protein KaiB